jgi:glyoxylase-like metal-dependent hydrolase (beta-lactamase superfamily II)
MAYEFLKQADNVYVIDAGMFGFDHYMSIFLVKGKKLALIDTGLPDSLERVRAGIKTHGFSVKDISYIFVTHEHADHSGNLGPLLRENPMIKAYINPLAAKWIIDPTLEDANRRFNLSPKMAGRFAPMEPVSASKLNFMKDGEVFDLGDGEKLKIMLTSGHQPGGAVIFEEKYNGLFINDLVGNCFADVDMQLVLNPPRSDIKLGMEVLKKIQPMPIKQLFLGHFGISENPQKLIKGAIDQTRRLLDIGARCVAEGKPEKIEALALELKLQEGNKVKARGADLHDYLTNELIRAQARLFAEYYLNVVNKKD